MSWAKLLRLYTMIGTVSAVSLITFSSLFSPPSLSIAFVAVGVIAMVSAILGFILAFVSAEGKSIPVETSQLPGWRPGQGVCRALG